MQITDFLRIIAGCILSLGLLLNPATSSAVQLIVPLYGEDTALTAESADRFDDLLDPDDILMVRGDAQSLQLLQRIRHRKIAVISQSLDALQRDLLYLRDQDIPVGFLCYNPSLRSGTYTVTPPEERNNLVLAVHRAKDIAVRNGLKLIVILDINLGLPAYGPRLSAMADIMCIQLQGLQDLPMQEFRARALDIINNVKTYGQQNRIFAQLSTTPPSGRYKQNGENIYTTTGPDTMLAMYRSVADDVDGLAFMLRTGDNGFELFEQFIDWLRPERPRPPKKY